MTSVYISKYLVFAQILIKSIKYKQTLVKYISLSDVVYLLNTSI